ncbi:hypothetical protein COLO4_24559 [Corchorus olitorius]|uniref:Uncharacterized protein n=1 Tax=Corchorus olitorius TaxID=93759 RepID=A0A1R3I941_9ROSI|nr:hypothetical protein COLO4_24559 [Corchorus olitorius]
MAEPLTAPGGPWPPKNFGGEVEKVPWLNMLDSKANWTVESLGSE